MQIHTEANCTNIRVTFGAAKGTWKMVITRKAPSLLAEPSLLLLPQASLIEVTKGRMRPPDLAATLGMAGARKASLQ